jgi:hypothetical protein
MRPERANKCPNSLLEFDADYITSGYAYKGV